MLLTSLFAQARALCRARGKSGRGVGADHKRPHARRASFERLERREVLSGGIVVTAIGATTSDTARDSFLDATTGNIVVAGSSQVKGSIGNFAVLRYTANGTLDPGFGTGGVLTTQFQYLDKPSVAANSYAQGVAAYPDGRIVAEGTTPGWSTVSSSSIGVARYNSNGSLDTTLNPPSGKVQTCVGSTWTRGYGGVIVQPVDGTHDKMIVAGEALGTFALLRYTSDGQLDATFNSTGIVTTPMGGNNSSAEAVTMQQGAILAVGNVVYNGGECSALVRYNLDGTLDTTFGTDGTGKVFTYANQGSLDFYDVAVYPAGSDHADYIVAAGTTYHNPGYSLTVARYSPDGTVDSGFGSGGIVDTYNPAGGALVGQAVTLQPDGKIVAAGLASTKYFFLARYNTDGSLDTTFGAGTGTVTTAIPNLSGVGSPNSLLVQPDGKIVATGFARDAASRYYIVLARYNPDGSLDNSFGGDTPSLAINDVSKSEGNSGTTAFTFTVTRSGNIAGAASVSYATANGTATAGSDYTATNGTLTFAPGEVTKTITVLVNGDKVKEANETFVVNLSKPAGATIADGTGIGTILNDDGGKTSSASASPAALTDAALADAGRQQLALAALLQYEDQLQAKPAARSKGLELPAIDLALLDLAS